MLITDWIDTWNEFVLWAYQFEAINESHIRHFERTKQGFRPPLYELKRQFAQRFQSTLTFSYVLQVELNIPNHTPFQYSLYSWGEINNCYYGVPNIFGSGKGIDSFYCSHEDGGHNPKYTNRESFYYSYDTTFGTGHYGEHDEYDDRIGSGNGQGFYHHYVYSCAYGFQDKDGSGEGNPRKK